MSDESLFREVDEEIRRERLEKLWKRYGNLFVAFSVGLIIAVAAFKGWQYYQQKQAEAAGQAYIEALNLYDAGKREEAALKLAELAAGSHKGVATLARLQQAGLAAADGKRDEAIRIYKEVAADKAVDAPLRDAARIRQAWLMVETAKPEELRSLLGGLDVAGNPWRTSAREVLALSFWRAGDLKAAQNLLNQIVTDTETPPGARERARIILAVIAPQLAGRNGAKKDDGKSAK